MYFSSFFFLHYSVLNITTHTHKIMELRTFVYFYPISLVNILIWLYVCSLQGKNLLGFYVHLIFQIYIRTVTGHPKGTVLQKTKTACIYDDAKYFKVDESYHTFWQNQQPSNWSKEIVSVGLNSLWEGRVIKIKKQKDFFLPLIIVKDFCRRPTWCAFNWSLSINSDLSIASLFILYVKFDHR